MPQEQHDGLQEDPGIHPLRRKHPLVEVAEQRGRSPEALIEQTARSGDLTGNLAADRDFHLTLLAAGGNRRLVGAVARLRDQTRLDNLRAINADGRLVASADEHRPLLAAIMRHDKRTAERLMRRHLEHIRQDWSRPLE